jgi:hypothetical protein
MVSLVAEPLILDTLVLVGPTVVITGAPHKLLVQVTVLVTTVVALSMDVLMPMAVSVAF